MMFHLFDSFQNHDNIVAYKMIAVGFSSKKK